MQKIRCDSRIPFQDELEAVLERIPPEQVRAMEAKIEDWANAVTENPNDFFASNWKTGPDWSESPFQPLYEAVGDAEQAGKRLGSQSGGWNSRVPSAVLGHVLLEAHEVRWTSVQTRGLTDRTVMRFMFQK